VAGDAVISNPGEGVMEAVGEFSGVGVIVGVWVGIAVDVGVGVIIAR